MTSEFRVVPLRWVLPLAQLLVCGVILWPMRPMLVSQIRRSLHAHEVPLDLVVRGPVPPQKVIPFDLSDPEVQLRIKRAEAREWTVAILNLPGGFPGLIYAMVSPAHSEWTPEGMFMWTWRDLSWPIIGIFFWWLAGRSIEALLFARHKVLRPRIRWWEAVVSLPVLAYGGMWAVMMSVDRGSRAEFPFWMLFIIFGSMWFVLGACTVAAWTVQWRLRRRWGSDAVEEATTLAPGT